MMPSFGMSRSCQNLKEASYGELKSPVGSIRTSIMSVREDQNKDLEFDQTDFEAQLKEESKRQVSVTDIILRSNINASFVLKALALNDKVFTDLFSLSI